MRKSTLVGLVLSAVATLSSCGFRPKVKVEITEKPWMYLVEETTGDDFREILYSENGNTSIKYGKFQLGPNGSFVRSGVDYQNNDKKCDASDFAIKEHGDWRIEIFVRELDYKKRPIPFDLVDEALVGMAEDYPLPENYFDKD